MQFVKTADLRPGMRLAKPIYNKMGVLLYERDTKLTMQGINSVENFGLIGIFILEPAEPVPPLSQEDIEFEQFQTVYMFQLKECMENLNAGKAAPSITELSVQILERYGRLDHKLNFTQNLRSSADFVYKHAISVAILSAMLAYEMQLGETEETALILAALLYDFGYLNVPNMFLEKGDHLESGERDLIQQHLEKGYEMINIQADASGIPKLASEIIRQFIFTNSKTAKPKEISPELQILVDILKVADRFDRMTAMSLNQTPVSELVAIMHLRKNNRFYKPAVVSALANCIQILPAGACVDFSNGEKGLVVADNPEDFLHPMILSFKDNRLYDLSDPAVGNTLKIADIMKTMDNRIKIDEHTLEHFVSDPQLKKTAERFRTAKIESAKQRIQQNATPAVHRKKLI